MKERQNGETQTNDEEKSNAVQHTANTYLTQN